MFTFAQIYADIERMAELLDIPRYNEPHLLDMIMYSEITSEPEQAKSALINELWERHGTKEITQLSLLLKKANEYE